MGSNQQEFNNQIFGKNNKWSGNLIQLVEITYKYICCICHFGLRRPFQTLSCGHRFCEECIKQAIICGSKMCPVDKTALTAKDIFRDRFCERQMMELEVFCSRKDRGCIWTGPLKSLEDHLFICPKFPLACAKRCQNIVDRSEMAKHLAYDCPYADTIFPSVGHRDFKGSRAEVHNHLAEKNVEHTSMVENKILLMQFDIEMAQTATTTMQEQQQQVLKNQVTNQGKELVSIGNDVATLHARLDRYMKIQGRPLKEESGKERHAVELSE